MRVDLDLALRGHSRVYMFQIRFGVRLKLDSVPGDHMPEKDNNKTIMFLCAVPVRGDPSEIQT